MLKYLRVLFLPFNVIYALVIFVRNKFYDWKIFKSTSFNLPIICIGNLAVGGSGKTPTTEYLVRLLKGYNIAILSRGYGRKTTGFILADATATAETIGDEPLQYYHKFKDVTVAVCEDRITGINHLKDSHDVILLDDAFQHRKVKAGFNILLFEFAKITSWQTLLPAGNMREPMSGVKRADVVVITKSPALIKDEVKTTIKQKIKLNDNQHLAFSTIKYADLIHLYEERKFIAQQQVVVFMLTGIANPKPLQQHLATQFDTVIPYTFPDHHQFTNTEIISFINAFKSHPAMEKIIITTEKDGQRLLSNNLKDLLLNLPVYYLPIFMQVDNTEFDQKILEYVARAKRFN